MNRRPLVRIAGMLRQLPLGDLIDKALVGLSSVDNTSDADKPLSTAQQLALDGKIDTTERGVSGGIPTLDAFARIPASQLPSYVDDVLEYLTTADFPATGEGGKIYIAINQGSAADPTRQYRWTGSAYMEINPSPGTTDALAEGGTNLYFNESRVRNTVLTGLSLASSAAVAATDTVLAAFGKLQAKLNTLGTAAFANLTTLPSTVGIIGTAAVALTLQRTGQTANLSTRFITDSFDKYFGLKGNGDFAVGDSADLTSYGNSLWHEGNFNPQGLPFINLMLDSGRFNGTIDPLSLYTDATFRNDSTLLTPYNGGVWSSAGEFIFNNNNNGGTAGTMTADVVSLMQAMGRAGDRYGVEFHVGSITQGSGTNVATTVEGVTRYLLSVNNSQAIAAAGNYATFVCWVRAKSGSLSLPAGCYINGVYQSTPPVIGATWVHYRFVILQGNGYNNAFPFFYAETGAVIQVGLPGFFNGMVDVGTHKSPLPTSPAIKEALDKLPKVNPTASGRMTLIGGGEQLRLEGPTSTANYLTIYENTTRRGYLGRGGTGLDLHYAADSGNMVLLSSTAAVQLRHAGVQKFTTTSGGVSISGTFSGTSDRKFKSNIQPHDAAAAWERIEALRVCSYFYDLIGSEFTGFIAQDVEPIYPHSVSRVEDEDGGHLTLTKDEIIADLVAVVQDQQQRLGRLEARYDTTH